MEIEITDETVTGKQATVVISDGERKLTITAYRSYGKSVDGKTTSLIKFTAITADKLLPWEVKVNK